MFRVREVDDNELGRLLAFKLFCGEMILCAGHQWLIKIDAAQVLPSLCEEMKVINVGTLREICRQAMDTDP